MNPNKKINCLTALLQTTTKCKKRTGCNVQSASKLVNTGRYVYTHSHIWDAFWPQNFLCLTFFPMGVIYLEILSVGHFKTGISVWIQHRLVDKRGFQLCTEIGI